MSSLVYINEWKCYVNSYYAVLFTYKRAEGPHRFNIDTIFNLNIFNSYLSWIQKVKLEAVVDPLYFFLSYFSQSTYGIHFTWKSHIPIIRNWSVDETNKAERINLLFSFISQVFPSYQSTALSFPWSATPKMENRKIRKNITTGSILVLGVLHPLKSVVRHTCLRKNCT